LDLEVLEREATKYARVVDHFIMERSSYLPERLTEAGLYLIKAGGKRLRPLITMLVARMLGGGEAEARALPLAAAIEVAHNFTLIHDDIMDQDSMRRGVPTTHVVYGTDWAILAGDYLYSLSYKFVTDSVEYGLSYEQAYKALRILAIAGIKVSRGQAYDMLYEERWDVGVADYLNMVYLKTGSLIEASARLGAVAAGGGSEIEELMGQYGSFLGVAFQIRDDILGVYGDPKKTGKPAFNDIIRGKKTLLILYTLSRLDEDMRREFKGLLKKGVEEAKRASEIIMETGTLKYALDLAKVYASKAKESLGQVRDVADEEAKRLLELLADYVIMRER